MARSASSNAKVVDEGRASGVEAPSPQAVADYIHAMSAELAAMAEQAHLRLLHYLLDMVRLEAQAVAKGQGGRQSPARPSGRRAGDGSTLPPDEPV